MPRVKTKPAPPRAKAALEPKEHGPAMRPVRVKVDGAWVDYPGVGAATRAMRCGAHTLNRALQVFGGDMDALREEVRQKQLARVRVTFDVTRASAAEAERLRDGTIERRWREAMGERRYEDSPKAALPERSYGFVGRGLGASLPARGRDYEL